MAAKTHRLYRTDFRKLKPQALRSIIEKKHHPGGNRENGDACTANRLKFVAKEAWGSLTSYNFGAIVTLNRSTGLPSDRPSLAESFPHRAKVAGVDHV
jgi:hypothetical protein